jgi:hypothetical protein
MLSGSEDYRHGHPAVIYLLSTPLGGQHKGAGSSSPSPAGVIVLRPGPPETPDLTRSQPALMLLFGAGWQEWFHFF